MQIIGIILVLLSKACKKTDMLPNPSTHFYGVPLFKRDFIPTVTSQGWGRQEVVFRASSILAPDRTLVLHLVLVHLDQYLHQFRRLKWLCLLWPLH